jgi:hypothetical protein
MDNTADSPRPYSRAALKLIRKNRDERWGHEGRITVALEDIGVEHALAFEIARIAFEMGARTKETP